MPDSVGGRIWATVAYGAPVAPEFRSDDPTRLARWVWNWPAFRPAVMRALREERTTMPTRTEALATQAPIPAAVDIAPAARASPPLAEASAVPVWVCLCGARVPQGDDDLASATCPRCGARHALPF